MYQLEALEYQVLCEAIIDTFTSALVEINTQG